MARAALARRESDHFTFQYPIVILVDAGQVAKLESVIEPVHLRNEQVHLDINVSPLEIRRCPDPPATA